MKQQFAIYAKIEGDWYCQEGISADSATSAVTIASQQHPPSVLVAATYWTDAHITDHTIDQFRLSPIRRGEQVG